MSEYKVHKVTVDTNAGSFTFYRDGDKDVFLTKVLRSAPPEEVSLTWKLLLKEPYYWDDTPEGRMIFREDGTRLGQLFSLNADFASKELALGFLKEKIDEKCREAFYAAPALLIFV